MSIAQQNVHLTLGILQQSQAVSYAQTESCPQAETTPACHVKEKARQQTAKAEANKK